MDEVKSKSAGKKAPRKAAATNGKPMPARPRKAMAPETTRPVTLAAAPAAQSAPATAAPRISPEERHRLIAEAAYYRASRRGFGGGAEVEDWLAAEAEVDGKLLRR